jgi:hypothetical protein
LKKKHTTKERASSSSSSLCTSIASNVLGNDFVWQKRTQLERGENQIVHDTKLHAHTFNLPAFYINFFSGVCILVKGKFGIKWSRRRRKEGRGEMGHNVSMHAGGSKSGGVHLREEQFSGVALIQLISAQLQLKGKWFACVAIGEQTFLTATSIQLSFFLTPALYLGLPTIFSFKKIVLIVSYLLNSLVQFVQPIHLEIQSLSSCI